MKAFAAVLCLLLVSIALIEASGDGKHKEGDNSGEREDDGPSIKLEYNGATVEVHGRSGKMAVYREKEEASGSGNDTEKKRKTPPVFIMLFEINETKSDGSAIDEKKNKGKHGFREFQGVDFQIGSKMQGSIPGSNVKSEYIEMNAQLKERTSKLKLKVHIAKENGTVDVDGEATDIVEGALKFSLELSDWEWCNATVCEGDEGEFVDISFAIGNPKSRMIKKEAKKDGRGTRFNLGEAAFAEFSGKSQLDGVWSTMPNEYPKLEEKKVGKGTLQIITVRFNKFNSTALYDPAVDSGYTYVGEDEVDTDDYDPSQAGDGSTSGATNVVTSMLASALMAMVALLLHR